MLNLYILGFLINVIHGRNIETTTYKTTAAMSWYDSYNHCNLAGKKHLHSFNDNYYHYWAGGIYLNSLWMEYLGCFTWTGPWHELIAKRWRFVSRTSCSTKCKMSPYFAFNKYRCYCLGSMVHIVPVHTEYCIKYCHGERANGCGGSLTFSFYSHISGLDDNLPRNSNDQNLRCTVIQLQKKRIIFKAEHCSEVHRSMCNPSNGAVYRNQKENYNNAAARCNLFNILSSNVSIKHPLPDGEMYWTATRRYPELHWVNRDNMGDFCRKYNIHNLTHLHCLLVTRNHHQRIKYYPGLCSQRHTAICTSKVQSFPDQVTANIKSVCKADTTNGTTITPRGSTYLFQQEQTSENTISHITYTTETNSYAVSSKQNTGCNNAITCDSHEATTMTATGTTFHEKQTSKLETSHVTYTTETTIHTVLSEQNIECSNVISCNFDTVILVSCIVLIVIVLSLTVIVIQCRKKYKKSVRQITNKNNSDEPLEGVNQLTNTTVKATDYYEYSWDFQQETTSRETAKKPTNVYGCSNNVSSNYNHLDFSIGRDNVRQFATEYDIANVPMNTKNPNPAGSYHPERPLGHIRFPCNVSNETGKDAYHETMLDHTEFLYDVPKVANTSEKV